MELSVNGRQRRAARVTNAAPQTEKKSTGISGGTVLKRPRSDRTSWSQGALNFLRELNRQDMERRRKELEARQKDSSGMETLSKSLKVMDKCQKIASRVMRGDKVPPQDEMYLMDKDPEGYKLALACRKPKEKPKEWESVLDGEDREGGFARPVGPAESGGGSSEAVGSGEEAAEV